LPSSLWLKSKPSGTLAEASDRVLQNVRLYLNYSGYGLEDCTVSDLLNDWTFVSNQYSLVDPVPTDIVVKLW
jgi:hypothetical protein